MLCKSIWLSHDVGIRRYNARKEQEVERYFLFALWLGLVGILDPTGKFVLPKKTSFKQRVTALKASRAQDTNS